MTGFAIAALLIFGIVDPVPTALLIGLGVSQWFMYGPRPHLRLLAALKLVAFWLLALTIIVDDVWPGRDLLSYSLWGSAIVALVASSVTGWITSRRIRRIE